MKRMLSIFTKSLLFPFAALLGAIPVDGAGTAGDQGEENQDNADSQAEDNRDGADEGSREEGSKEKLVQMTQAELDKLINRKYREGLRKGKAQAQPAAGTEEQAEQRLLEANKRLLRGVVKEQAAGANLTAKGASFALLALQAAGLEEYLNDDGVDEEAVADFIARFAEENAEFLAAKRNSGTGGAANPKRGKPQTNSVGERLARSIAPPTKSAYFSN